MCLAASLAVGLPLLPTGAVADDGAVDPYERFRDDVERGEFAYDDSQDIPWIENETEILAPPREEDLVQVGLRQMPKGMRLLIDTRRISVDPDDGVVRLWLVLRSDAGVDNGTYEGYRCDTYENKVYAYATPRRTPPVTKALSPRWREVKPSRLGNHRMELLIDYFCTLRGTRTADEIRLALAGQVERETWYAQ